MAKKKEKLEGRVRYEENWRGEGEYFIFEIKWTDEKEWGLRQHTLVEKIKCIGL